VIMNAYANTHLIVSEVEVSEAVPAPAAVADLAVLRLDGVTLGGFDPAKRAYTVDVDGGRLPAVDAIAVDRAATVRVTQPTTANGGVGTVVVTSADGTARAEYSVTIRRHAVIDGLALADRPRVGTPSSAVGTLNPADGEIAYQWFRNGLPISGATDTTYTPVTNDAGKLLSVRVTVSADGVASATAETPSQRIRRRVTGRHARENGVHRRRGIRRGGERDRKCPVAAAGCGRPAIQNLADEKRGAVVAFLGVACFGRSDAARRHDEAVSRRYIERAEQVNRPEREVPDAPR